MANRYYASVFCDFLTEHNRNKWMAEHVIAQSTPNGGPVFSYSYEDESGFRDMLMKREK